MVAPSMSNRVLVPRLAGAMVSARAPASARAARTNGPHFPGLSQMPTLSRKSVPRMPVADAVTTP